MEGGVALDDPDAILSSLSKSLNTTLDRVAVAPTDSGVTPSAEALSKRVAELESELSVAREQMAAVREGFNKTLAEQDKSAELSRLNTELQTKNSALTKLSEENASKEADIGQLKQQLLALDKLTEDLKQREEKLVKLNEEGRLRDEEINKLKQNITELNQVLAEGKQKEAQSAKLGENLKAKEQELASATERIALLEKERNALNKDKSDAELRQKQENEKAEKDRSMLEKQRDKLIDNVLQLQGQIASQKASCEKQTDELKKKGLELTLAGEELNKLEKIRSRVEELERIKGELAAKLTAAQNTEQTLRFELDKKRELESTQATLLSEKEKTKLHLEILKDEVRKGRSMKVEFEKLKVEHEKLKKHSKNLEAQLTDLQAKLKAKTDELQKTSSGVETTRKDLLTSKEELNNLNRQLSRTQQDLKLCQDRLSKSESQLGKVNELERALISSKNELLLRESQLKALTGSLGSKDQKAPPGPALNPTVPSATASPSTSSPSRLELPAEESPVQALELPGKAAAGSDEEELAIERLRQQVNKH